MNNRSQQNKGYTNRVTVRDLITVCTFSLNKEEFILLLTGFLQTVTPSSQKLSQVLNKIQRQYLNLNYSEAIQNLLLLSILYQNYINAAFAKEFPNQSINFTSFIFDKAKILIPPDILQSDSRRFFETHVAKAFEQNYLNNETVFGYLNAVLNKFTNIKINSLDTLTAAILQLHELPTKLPAMVRGKEFIKETKTYYTKDLIRKAGMFDSNDEKQETNAIYSKNSGILRSVSPNFSDELIDEEKNRVTDRNTLSGDPEGFSVNRNIPLVGSISGHAYGMIAILEEYMQDHSNDPNLSQVINAAYLAFLTVFVNKGFHSIGEIHHVRSDLEFVFEKYNVKLTSFPDNVLNQAFLETQTYTNRLCQKRAVLQELITNNIAKHLRENDWQKVLEDISKQSQIELYQFFKYKGMANDFLKTLFLAAAQFNFSDICFLILETRPEIFPNNLWVNNIAAALQLMRSCNLQRIEGMRDLILENPNQVIIPHLVELPPELLNEPSLIKLLLTVTDEEELGDIILNAESLYSVGQHLNYPNFFNNPLDADLGEATEIILLNNRFNNDSILVERILNSTAPLTLANAFEILFEKKYPLSPNIIELLFSAPDNAVTIANQLVHPSTTTPQNTIVASQQSIFKRNIANDEKLANLSQEASSSNKKQKRS